MVKHENKLKSITLSLSSKKIATKKIEIKWCLNTSKLIEEMLNIVNYCKPIDSYKPNVSWIFDNYEWVREKGDSLYIKWEKTFTKHGLVQYLWSGFKNTCNPLTWANYLH